MAEQQVQTGGVPEKQDRQQTPKLPLHALNCLMGGERDPEECGSSYPPRAAALTDDGKPLVAQREDGVKP